MLRLPNEAMHAGIERRSSQGSHGVWGFEAIQEFEYESGLVEGIGYRDGQLVRYTAGSLHGSPFECEPITLAEALHWWAELQKDLTADTAFWQRGARVRFLEEASEAVHH
jgi:hypothetical protein